MPHSQMKFSILKILQKHKFVLDVEVDSTDKVKKLLRVKIEERNLGDVVPTFKRCSKPGRRIYVSAEEIRPVNSGYGIAVVSTSKGVMSGYEAHKAGLGGEYLCEIY